MTTAAADYQGRDRACPSGVCHEGGSIIGVMTEQGRLAYLPTPVVLDTAFASRLQDAGEPERRYRFSQPCIESACSQWTGEGCGVIDHVLDDPPGSECAHHHGLTRPGVLPSCAIRRDCRWFSQRGPAACRVCPTIVADTGGSAT
ncbi:hypothetical protein [Streptomyces sp. NRRL F-5123]|uniref:hypothetical protein n=1 Tax=Streptomyces sp. NRRL F-5123 TaxID=1463856 RepID=UPI0004E1CBB0|nr:hypothetical protein [Streptomyces sp. NRRL F-5123]